MTVSERTGVVFPADPSTGDQEQLVVEALAGHSELIAHGRTEPDTYIVARDPLHIVSVRLGTQPRSDDDVDERVLTSEEILTVARLGIATQDHYGSPQEVRWTMAGGRTWLVSCRPLMDHDSDQDEGLDQRMSAEDKPTSDAWMSEERCRQLLSATRVSRVAYVDSGQPRIVVLNHAIDGDDVVFQTSEDTALARLTAHGIAIPVTIETDSASASSHSGWSIVATGRLARTAETDVRHRPHPWRAEAVGVLLRLEVDEIHGLVVDHGNA